MVRTALHVRDAVSLELLLKGGRSAPRRVLTPLVGQDLSRGTIVRDAAREGLHHERALLVMRHHEAHKVARVVVHEGRHVYALLPAQQERKEIRLPQLVRLRPLETQRRGFRPGLAPRRFALARKPLLPQHPAHRRLRGAQAEETLHDVANAPAAGLRLFALDGHHGISPGIRPIRLPRASLQNPLRQQRRLSARAVLAPPLAHRRVGNVQLLRDLLCIDPLIDDHRGGRLHHLQRPDCSSSVRATVATTPCTFAALGLHRVCSFGATACSPIEGRVLGNFHHTRSRIRWFAAQSLRR